MWLTRISVNNPVFATMMMASLLVVGLFAYFKLSVEQFPDVEFPIVLVNTSYPGATPESVESEVTRPIEDAVNTISGVRTLTSRSLEGRSTVIIEFELTVNAVAATQDVREKIALVTPRFRDEIKMPEISRFSPDNQPVASITIRSERRDAIRDALAKEGIASSVFYPMPLHKQPAYASLGKVELPVAENVSKSVLSLPIHPFLDDASIDRIAACVRKVA